MSSSQQPPPVPPPSGPPPPGGTPPPPPPNGSPPPNSADTSSVTNANYFFGFVITFVVLLLLFVGCGIGSWRRFRLIGTAWDERLQDMEGSPFATPRKRGRRRLVRPVFSETWTDPMASIHFVPGAASDKEKWGGVQVSFLGGSNVFAQSTDTDFLSMATADLCSADLVPLEIVHVGAQGESDHHHAVVGGAGERRLCARRGGDVAVVCDSSTSPV